VTTHEGRLQADESVALGVRHLEVAQVETEFVADEGLLTRNGLLVTEGGHVSLLEEVVDLQ